LDEPEMQTEAEELDPEQAALRTAELELAHFEAQLQPIERYGVNIASQMREDNLDDALEFAEVEMEESKKNLRLDQMKALREADEEKADVEEDDMLYCYGAYNPADRMAELDRLEQELLEEEQLIEAGLDEHQIAEAMANKRQAAAAPTRGRGKPRLKPRKSELADDSSVKSTPRIVNRPDSVGTPDYDEFDQDYPETCTPLHQNGDRGSFKASGGPFAPEHLLSSRRGRPSAKRINYQMGEDTPSDEDFDVDMDAETGEEGEETPWNKRRKLNFSSEFQDYDDVRPSRGRGRGRGSPGFGLVRAPRRPVTTTRFGYDATDFVYYDSRFSMPRKRNRMPDSTKQEQVPLDTSDLGDGIQIMSDWNKRQKRALEPEQIRFSSPPLKPASAYQKRVRNHNSNTMRSSTVPQPSASRFLMSSSQPTSSLLKLPPRPSAPPMPLRLPVHTVKNSAVTEMPVTQLLRPEGTPVFVVTRQIQTAGGEVVKQRFTHPVQAPAPFTAAVKSLSRVMTEPTYQTHYNATKITPIRVASPISPSPVIHHIPRTIRTTMSLSNGHLNADKNNPTTSRTRIIPILRAASSSTEYKPSGMKVVYLNSNQQVKTVISKSDSAGNRSAPSSQAE
ncbi:hypothetical protein Ciccas_010252, partial [Cichlidogyrus casuarinus]